MVVNSLGRLIPESALGGRPVFAGEFAQKPKGRKAGARLSMRTPPVNKVMSDLKSAICEAGLRSGMTVSFHHHLRNGDYVLNMVIAACAELGLKDLTIASSSIFPIHSPLVEHIKNGVVTGLEANYIVGPVGDAVSRGILARPVVMRTHGGRVRAIESGELHIDVAFVAAPTADKMGNLNGLQGPSACGSLGYAVADAQYAETVIAVTDNLVPHPVCPISIPGCLVDMVTVVDKIGEASGIVSGSTRVARDPIGLVMAKHASRVIEAAGLLVDGFSFQSGAGGPTLATAAFIRKRMEEEKVQGSFGLGGITQYFVEMLEAGLFRTLLDTQDFDLQAVKSLSRNPAHQEIDCGFYANPHNKGAIVNSLDAVVLGATEVDTSFNVNVTTSSDGIIMGGSGGHSDAAAGARLTVVITTSARARLPIIRDRVTALSTPGESVDVVVTERGIAVNPLRAGLADRLLASGLPVRDICAIKDEVESLTGRPQPAGLGDRVVAINEYRDGSVIDVVRQVL